MNLSTENLLHGLSIYRQLAVVLSFLTLIAVAQAVNAADGTNSESDWLQAPMTMADARHLAGRTGFGASAMELDALVNLTREEAVQRIVDKITTTPYIPMPVWVDEPAPRFWKRGSLTEMQRQRFNRERDDEVAELRQWWVNNMVQSDSPQTERLVLFWHDHFATSYEGVNRRSISIARQNRLFREMGTGSYRAFLKAMIRDPALLIYLDNQNSRKGKPNENLARELLELFTLGEGNFDEVTVKEAARALTGYGISETRNHTFRLHAYKHDRKDKTLFGVTDKHNGDSLIDIILEQPAAATHLAKKFWAAFVSDHEPDAVFVETQAESFRQSDYNLLLLYQSVLQSRQFWDETNRLSLIKSPATLLIGTARSLDYPKRAWSQLAPLHTLLGMELFAPPNVSGWKEGAAFVAPGRLLNRQLALQTILSASDSEPPTASASMISGKSMMAESNAMQNNAMSGLMASAESMMGNSPNTMQTSAPVQVRLAGHFYKGAPKFNLALYKRTNEHQTKLWASEERELRIGYDTELFGPMQQRSMLPWLSENYSPAAHLLVEATHVEIEFLNDAAGKTGDRNLFVDSVVVNSQSYSAVGAKQTSHCVPNSRREAGSLYCAGTVSIALTNNLPARLERESDFTATDARIIWTNQSAQKRTRKNKGRRKSGESKSAKNNDVTSGNNRKLDAIIALGNIQTPDDFFHTVSFHLHSVDEQSMQLRLDSFGCWPDCIEIWPECAWREDISNEKSLVFPLSPSEDANIDCHYESLSPSQRQLVNTIWKSVPKLISHVLQTETRERHIDNLKLWAERVQLLEQKITTSEFARSGQVIAVNADYDTPVPVQRPLAEPSININSLTVLGQQLNSRGLSLADLLIGGVDVASIPELSAKGTASIEQKLQNILSHPVYQVY